MWNYPKIVFCHKEATKLNKELLWDSVCFVILGVLTP